MKTKLRRRAKAALSILLSLCVILSVITVGIASASAATVDGDSSVGTMYDAYLYFVKPSGWTYATLLMGHDSYTNTYGMTNISGTDIYYVKGATWTQNQANAVAFIDASATDWSSQSNTTVNNRRTYASHYTDVRTSGFTTDNTYYITATENSSGSKEYTMSATKTSSDTSTGYTSLNNTLTIKTMVYNGSEYEEVSENYGTYSASDAKYLSGNGTASDAPVSQLNGVGTLSTVRTNTATISQTSPSNYSFMGWKTSKDPTGSSLTTGDYSHTNSGSDTTIYAYYKFSGSFLSAPAVNLVSRTTANSTTFDAPTTANNTDIINMQITNYADLKDYCTFTSSVGTMSEIDESGNFTLTGLPASDAGTDNNIVITATIKSASQASYSFGIPATTATSGTSTIKVYKPAFCLVGNIQSAYLSAGGDSTATDTDWNTFRTATLVGTPVDATPGVYSHTVTTVAPAAMGTSRIINIGFRYGDTTSSDQYGFRLRTTSDAGSTRSYNFIGADYAIPGYGVTSDMNAYMIAKSGDGAGSLILQPSTTYTITIDQTADALVSGDKGKMTITPGSVPTTYDFHYGTASGNYGFGTYTDAFGDSVSETGEKVAMTALSGSSTQYYCKVNLTGEQDYYYYVTSSGAGAVAGVYYKNVTTSSTPVTASLNTAKELWTYGNKKDNSVYTSWGQTCSTLKFTPETDGNYMFVFDYTNTNYVTLTVYEGDYLVSAAAKMSAFNPNTRANDSEVTDLDANVTANGESLAYVARDAADKTVYLEAPEVSGYTFAGWYSDAACTTPASALTDSTSASTTVAVEASVAYYAKYNQNAPGEYNIIVSSPESGAITVGGSVTATTPKTAYKGATVTLSIGSIASDMKFTEWKLTNSTGADVTTVLLPGTDSSVTTDDKTSTSVSFTMPNYNVFVTANVIAKPLSAVSVSSKNDSLGTAARTVPAPPADPGEEDNPTIYMNETVVTAVATNVSGVFQKWILDGVALESGYKATDTTIQFKTTKPTATLVADFDYKEYQLCYDGGTIPMVRVGSGADLYYISAGTVSNSHAFTIKDVSADTYLRSGSDPYEFKSTWLKDSSISSRTWSTYSSSSRYKWTESGTKYVKFIPSTSLEVVDNYDATSTMANVYTKEGTIRLKEGDDTKLYTDGGRCTAAFADYTKITKIGDTNVSALPKAIYATDYAHKYKIPVGTDIVVETKLTSTMKSEHWYVSHYVVNGWKVNASKKSDGVYFASINIGSDFAIPANASYDDLDTNAYEITPVLYNTDIENDTTSGGGYFTFYVDAENVPAHWGTTVGAQGYYSGATETHYTGTYPGVPMARVGQYYELKIPKAYYKYSSTNSKMEKQPNAFSSLTITAYFADAVHHYIYKKNNSKFWDDGTNYQTYDYADAGSLAKIPNIQAIMFRNKYETSKTNKESASHWEAPGSSDVNSYQLLTDYYGNPVDLLGNVLTVSDTSYANAEVKVVSNGNHKNATGERSKGAWTTDWHAYAKKASDGKFWRVAHGTAADFINETPGTAADFINETPGTATVTQNLTYYSDGKFDTYDVELLRNKLTYVSYEKELENDHSDHTDDTGIRSDGQWYYSALGSEFNANVEVATTTDGTTFTIETNAGSENGDGFVGNTSGTVAKLDNLREATYTDVTTVGTLDVKVGAGYTFEGWYIKGGTAESPTYTKIGDNYKDLTTTMLINNTYTFVAVVKVVPTGALVITHNKYTGTSPDANDGTGKYYVSAKVYASADAASPKATDGTFAEAQNSLSITNLASTDYIEITLRTKCNGDDQFYAWYEEELDSSYKGTGRFYEICDEVIDYKTKSEAQYTMFRVKAAKFFSGDNLTRKTLDFYSDIVHVSAFANITYKYYDRFAENGAGQMVSYFVKGIELDADEIANNYIPSDTKIAKYAPEVIDTIKLDTKWVITDIGNKIERSASNVTVMATQQDKDCFVSYIPAEEVADSLFNSKGEIAVNRVADWVNITSPFNRWIISKTADLDNPDEDDFIVKAPESVQVGDVTWNFVRFDVYEITNRTTGTIGEKLYSSNDKTFGFRIYNDCAIYPVYTDEAVAKDITANIEAPVLNREIYGDSATPTDRVYVDLLLSYINVSGEGKSIQVIKENVPSSSGYYVESGVIVDKTIKLSSADYATLSTAGKNRTEDTTATVIASYKTQFDADSIDTLAQTNWINTTTYERTSNKTTGTYSYLDTTHNLTKYVNTNSLLTNKNRIDKVLTYTNNKDNQEYVYAAYSYVVVRRTSDNEMVGYAKSDAQYYNFCYLGNKPVVNES